MRLLVVVYPVDHLEASVEYYRLAGLRPVWWPDDTSVVLASDLSSPAALLLVNDPVETTAGAGGMFLLRNLDGYHQAHPDLDWIQEPVDRNIGRYASFFDRSGHAVRLLEYGRDRVARTVLSLRRPPPFAP